jgi:hypothetical protein
MFDSIPARLMLIDGSGELRSVALNGIGRNAGLAADRRGGRAFVVGAGRRAAEVDLRTMSARYRRLRVFGTRKLTVEVAGERAHVSGRGTGGRLEAWMVDARSGDLIRTLAPPRRGYDVWILGSRLGSGALPR